MLDLKSQFIAALRYYAEDVNAALCDDRDEHGYGKRARAALATGTVMGRDDVLEALLGLIDELYRKYGTELDAEDTAIAQSARAALSTMARRDDVLEEAARAVEQVRAQGDDFERHCGGWDDPSIPDDKRRSWHNPAARDLEKAASAIRALKVQS